MSSWSAWYGRHRFAGLLGLLVLLIIGTPVLIDLNLPVWWLDGLMALLILAAVCSLCFERHERWFALAVGIPSILITAITNTLTAWWGSKILLGGRVCQIVFLFGAALLIIRSLFHQRKFTFDAVFGAICGYLFVGLGWSVLFLLAELFEPGSFQMNQAVLPSHSADRSLALEMTYFSFVTLTTVGYGDILPMSPVTRTLAVTEAITGQFYLAIVVAGLVNTMATARKD